MRRSLFALQQSYKRNMSFKNKSNQIGIRTPKFKLGSKNTRIIYKCCIPIKYEKLNVMIQVSTRNRI